MKRRIGSVLGKVGLLVLGGSLLLGHAAWAINTGDQECYGPAPGHKTGCDYSKNFPCSDLANNTSSQVHSFCSSMSQNDRACDWTWPLATGYTVMAGVCAIACASGWLPWGAWSVPYCIYGSTAASLADLGAGIYLSTRADEYKNKAGDIISREYGLTGPIASVVMNGWTAVTNVTVNAAAARGAEAAAKAAGEKAANAAYQEAYKGAAEKATQEALANGASKTAAHNAGVEAGKKAGEEAAKKAGEEATKKAGEQTAKSGSQKAMPCVQLVVDGIMATIKWKNYGAIKSASAENYANLCDQACCKPPRGGGPGAGSPKTPFGAPGAVSAPTLGDSRDPTPIVGDEKDKIAKGFKDGNLASILATGDFAKHHGNPSPEGLQKAFDAFRNNTGIAPEDFAAAAAKDGMGSAISGLLGNSPESQALADAMKQAEREAKALPSSGVSFASSDTGGGRSPGGAQGSPFGSLFGQKQGTGDTAGSAKELKFGGFSGDIWHAGTNKTIFEIVSDKTSAVSHRVMK